MYQLEGKCRLVDSSNFIKSTPEGILKMNIEISKRFFVRYRGCSVGHTPIGYIRYWMVKDIARYRNMAPAECIASLHSDKEVAPLAVFEHIYGVMSDGMKERGLREFVRHFIMFQNMLQMCDIAFKLDVQDHLPCVDIYDTDNYIGTVYPGMLRYAERYLNFPALWKVYKSRLSFKCIINRVFVVLQLRR